MRLNDKVKKKVDQLNNIRLSAYEKAVLWVCGITLPVTLLTLILLVRRTHIQEQPDNIRLYVMTAFVFLVTAAAAAFGVWKVYGRHAETVEGRRDKSKKAENEKRWHKLFVLLGLGAAGGLILVVLYGLWDSYVDSAHIYPYLSYEWFFWHNLVPNKVMLLLLAGTGTAGILLAFKANRFFPEKKIFYYIYYTVISLFAGFAGYLPNFIYNDIHHGNAYFASVYNIMQGNPYTEVCRSIYGHYAILLQYPVRLLGGSYQAFNIVIALCGAVTIFLACLILQRYIRNCVLRLLAAGALPFAAYLLPQNRWQIFPHRFFFPMIILYMASIYFHRKSRVLAAVGYAAAALAVLWNLESGVVCVLVWTCTIAAERISEKRIRRVKDFPLFFLVSQGICALCALAGSYGLFEAFNLMRGGKRMGIDEFLYPLVLPAVKTQIVTESVEDTVQTVTHVVEDTVQTVTHVVENTSNASAAGEVNSYFMDLLSVLLPYENSYWYYAFVLFGLGMLIAVVSYVFNRVSKTHLMLFAASLTAFGQLVYFVNRPDFSNLSIGYLDAVIVLAILADQRKSMEQSENAAQEPYQGKHDYPLRMLCTAVLAVLCLFAIALGLNRIYVRNNTGNYNMQGLNALMQDMEEHIPDGVPAFGGGIQEVYAQMGRDTIWHLTDMNDTTTSEHYFIFGNLAEVEECVISMRNKSTRDDFTIESFVDAFLIGKTRPFELLYEVDMGERSVWDWNIYYIRFLDR